MVNKALINYIKSELAKGFDINTVRQHLIENGYRQDIVDKAIHELYAPKHVSKATLVIAISLILSVGLIAGIIFTYFPSGKGDGKLLDVEVDLYKTSLKPSESLDFNVDLTNLGAEKRYDVTIRYFIKDNTAKVVNSKEQTVAIETSTSKRLSISVPEDSSEGNYNLIVIARYDSKEARASSSFIVKKKGGGEGPPIIEEPSCDDGIKNQGEKGVDCGGPCEPCSHVGCPSSCDDDNECTEDYCSWETDYECKNDIIKDCCGNNICEDGEDNENCVKDCELFSSGMTMYDRIEKIKEIAKSDPKTAGGYCRDIQQVTYRDLCFVGLATVTKFVDNCEYVEEERKREKCYSEVAEVTNNSKLCEKISLDSRRDSCYLTFVMNKDYSVCDKIVNEYLRNSCSTLSTIEE